MRTVLAYDQTNIPTETQQAQIQNYRKANTQEKTDILFQK